MTKLKNQIEIKHLDIIPLVLERLEDNFPTVFRYGGSIPKREVRRVLACWFSFDKRRSRLTMKILDNRYEFIKTNRTFVKVVK